MRFFRARRTGLIAGLAGLYLVQFGMAAPENDNLIDAQVLGPALPVATTGNNTGATLEAGEWNFGGSSLWYSWNATSSGWVTVDTIDGNATTQLDTVLAVYTGSEQSALALVGSNDQAWGGETNASKLTFYAVAETTYRIAVFGYNSGASVAEGEFSLHLTSASPEVRVTGISVSSATVDVSTGSQTVNMTVTIASDADLFQIAEPSFLLRSPDELHSLLPVAIASENLRSGNSTYGTYEIPVTIPGWIYPGDWIPAVQIFEIVGSSTNVWSSSCNGTFQDHWIISGSKLLLSVINPAPDVDAPVLTSFSVSPASAALYERVTANLTITDAGGSGFQQADIYLINRIARLAVVTSANRVSGDAFSGQYQVSFRVPSDLAEGSHPFEVVLVDAAVNDRIYDGRTAGAISPSPSLDIGTDSIIEGWRREFFGDTANIGNAADTADPDKDGLVNLMEFATGHSPLIPDSGAQTLTMAGNSLTLSYNSSRAAAKHGVTLVAEWSDTLSGTWSAADTKTVAEGEFEDQIQATVPMEAAQRRFMRLRACSP